MYFSREIDKLYLRQLRNTVTIYGYFQLDKTAHLWGIMEKNIPNVLIYKGTHFSVCRVNYKTQ